MAFVRCLTPDIVAALAEDMRFVPSGWRVYRVTDIDNDRARAITADRAVEMGETKGDAALLLVDTVRAGAGMDGIYSATEEVHEGSLFREALRLAAHEVTVRVSRRSRDYAERAIRRGATAAASAFRSGRSLIFLFGLRQIRSIPASFFTSSGSGPSRNWRNRMRMSRWPSPGFLLTDSWVRGFPASLPRGGLRP